MAKSQLFLIDAHALCYRAYFAVQNLRTSYGQPTNAVFGFNNTLKKIINDFHPCYMAACFDAGKKTHRQMKFSDYKVHRPPMPDDLISQIALIKELVLAYNIPVFELEGFEADDLIATIATQVDPKKVEAIIVSGDKDMIQLVRDNIKIFDYRREEILDTDKIKARFGFAPAQIVDFISLAGDATDNIPGVKGIGKVTATKLIQEYGSLEHVLSNVSKISASRISQMIEEQKDQAQLSRELALLDRHAPFSFDLSLARMIDPDQTRLKQIFEKLEFRKLFDDIPTTEKPLAPLMQLAINTKKELEKLLGDIKEKKKFSFSLGSDSDEENMFSLQSMMIALDPSCVFVVSQDLVDEMNDVFKDPHITKICYDLKSLLKALDASKVNLSGPIFDVMLAGYVLETSPLARDIDALARKYLQRSVNPKDACAQHTVAILELFEPMTQVLKDRSLVLLLEDMEMPLTHVLYLMEQQGVCLDIDFLKTLSFNASKEIDRLSKALYQMAGEEFNLNSPKQLGHILFDKLKLPPVKKIKTGFSTDEGVLHKLALKHEFPKLLLEYRQITKLTSTYIDALPKLVDPRTQRIHACFDQAGTETGRLSSRNPNLQNIPIRTELGRQIRKAFIACDKNSVLVSADYSQIELRILAHLSKDENLIRAFHQQQDIHNVTAGLIFDCPPDQVTSEMRYTAKRINFGIVYGMSAFGLSKDLGVSQKEAQDFIDRYFLRYPKVLEYMNAQIKKAERDGFVSTLLHRRRYLPEIHSRNVSLRQFAQRQAINTPVQGSAAHLIKLAMIQVYRRMEQEKLRSRMTITVHDELVFNVDKKEQSDMIDLIRTEMESPLTLDVPIQVSIKVGDNWLETKEVAR